MIPLRTYRILQCLLVCGASVCLLAQQPTQAIVHIHVDTAYDDSDASLSTIKSLIDDLPPRKETLQQGESLSAFILRIFDVSTFSKSSPSYLPRTYVLIEARILSLNRVTQASALKAGPTLVPDLPKKALAHFNPTLIRNSIPLMMKFDGLRSRISAVTDKPAASFESLRTSTLNAQKATATQSADIEVSLPQSLSRTLLNDPSLKEDSTALSFPLTAHLARSPVTLQTLQIPDHAVLTDAEQMQLRQLLTSQAQRVVPLFILDTGWPDGLTYTASRTDLRNLLATAWSTQLSSAGPMPTLSDPPFSGPPINPHSAIVQRALAEFQSLDPSTNVHIIYIPLTQEQNAGGLLGLMLETSYLLQYHAEHPAVPITPTVVAVAKQNANTIVLNLQKQWSGEDVNTDKAILDAVLRIGEAWGKTTNTGFVVNESWTVQHEQYFVYYPEPPQGIVVAAAGNSGQDLNAAETDFSQRCSTTLDTLAVMNLAHDGGLTCCSSHIAEDQITGPLAAMAVGFDGEVQGTGCDQLCGTSFAAPRVAWIVAAGESLRTGPFTPDKWGLTVKSRLFAARNSGLSGWAATWLDPVGYLTQKQ